MIVRLNSIPLLHTPAPRIVDAIRCRVCSSLCGSLKVIFWYDAEIEPRGFNLHDFDRELAPSLAPVSCFGWKQSWLAVRGALGTLIRGHPSELVRGWLVLRQKKCVLHPMHQPPTFHVAWPCEKP